MIDNKVDLTPFIAEIDRKTSERTNALRELVERRQKIAKLIAQCKESGPLMRSLCKELSDIKKAIGAI